MKAILLATLLAVTACAPTAKFPPGQTPLDEPGYRAPTQAELHLENLRLITHDPARQ